MFNKFFIFSNNINARMCKINLPFTLYRKKNSFLNFFSSKKNNKLEKTNKENKFDLSNDNDVETDYKYLKIDEIETIDENIRSPVIKEYFI
jgi:hypothetical protein